MTLRAGQTFFLFVRTLAFYGMFVGKRPVTFTACAERYIRPFDFMIIQIGKHRFVGFNIAVDYVWLFSYAG